MNKMDGKSKDLLKENIEQLEQLFPEVCCEDKIDFDKLKQILGEYVDDDKERYNFTWNGKGRSLRLSQTPSLGTLRPCKEESKDWDSTQNLYIEGDNLEVLKLLQKSYYGKIKMIYIDPPYNSKGDFVYPDNFSDNIHFYKIITRQIDSDGNTISNIIESDGRRHTNWLNMMYSRLKLARNLLSDEGAIFISIDDNEIDNLKKICNEIFGESNFVGQWNWFKSATPPNLSNKIKKNIEYILCYEKRKTPIKYQGIKKTSKSSNGLLNQTNKFATLIFPGNVVESGLPNGVYSAGNYGTSNYEINLLNDVKVENGKFVNDFKLQAKFKWSQKNLLAEIEKGTKISIRTETFSPSYEKSDYEPEVPPNFINKDVNVDTNEEAGKYLCNLFNGIKVFEYPKPIELVMYLSNFICNNNDLILDFFSGSATTAHAVMQMNAEDGGDRRFIMVQLPEVCGEKTEAYKAGYKNICEIGKERIRRAGEKIKAEIEAENAQLKIDEETKKVPDIGFRVFKLDSSNLKKWQPDYDDLEKTLLDSIENYVEGRSELDVVYEIILKMGLDLTYPVDELDINGRKIYSVAFGALMICLDDYITKEIADSMISLYQEYQPELWKVVFKDNGFESDSAKTNIKEQLKAAGLEEDAFTTI